MASWSPYNYVFGNPLMLTDPTGMAPMGDYYGTDGTWLYSDGKEDDKAYVVSYENTSLPNGETSAKVVTTELSTSNSDIQILAATSYGEASTGDVKKEIYGIASAIINNKEARGSNATITSTIEGFAFAESDGNERFSNFQNSSNGQKNANEGMKMAVAGAINAVAGGTDYSGGATHWAGTDINSNVEKRNTGGLFFSSSSHDLYNLGNKTAKGAPISTYWKNSKGQKTSLRGTYNYKWDSTAAHGATTFMKKNQLFINATGERRW